MCSIVGFISKGDKGPDINRLKSIIVANKHRGGDAHGLAWIDKHGRLQLYKAPGAFAANLHVLDYMKDARVVIAHLRLTTQGTHKSNINNHPHACGDGFLVHNGMISDYRRLVKLFQLLPNSECDSEVIGLIANSINGSKIDQLRKAIDLTDHSDPFACMVIHSRPARLFIAKRGNPCEVLSTRNGHYFASLLPHTNSKPLKDNMIFEFAWSPKIGGKLVRSMNLAPYEFASYELTRSCNWSHYEDYEPLPTKTLLPGYGNNDEDVEVICDDCGEAEVSYADGRYKPCKCIEALEEFENSRPDYPLTDDAFEPTGDHEEDKWRDVVLMSNDQLDSLPSVQ